MGQFGINTRTWLESIIRQRERLVRFNQSRKSQPDIIKALFVLKNQLNNYSYENDLYMARFIRQQLQNIEIILPGEGSTCHDKQKRELEEIKKTSILLSEKPADSLPGKDKSLDKMKIREYEDKIF